MDRNRALTVFLSGTIGQILLANMVVFLLRSMEIQVDDSTPSGILAIAVGGISSALWGVIVAVKYKESTVKKVFSDFVNVKQSYKNYLFMSVFLLLDFCNVLIGGQLQITVWYMPFMIFLKSILFGGIEEIGWRYTFQPILEEKVSYIPATVITFFSWGVWHLLYFYLDGSINQIQASGFLLGLLTNCFILSALYHKTNSLWICVMAHALINTFSQILSGGNAQVLFVCRGIIIVLSIVICMKEKKHPIKQVKTRNL